MAELLIRAGRNDHEVIENVLATSGMFGSRRGQPFSRLVVDGPTARDRQQLSEIASHMGLPFLVDPLTYFWQSQVSATDTWARLSFGQEQVLTPSALDDRGVRRDLVAAAIDFQINQGASNVIPPYVYVSGGDDPWAIESLRLLEATVEYMSQQNIHLPVAPIICGQLQKFDSNAVTNDWLSRMLEEISGLDTAFVGLMISPTGSGTDGTAKLMKLFNIASRVTQTGLSAVAWRSGLYGPALTAAGLSGYETGVTSGDATDVASAMSRRKPKPADRKKGGGGAASVFLEPLGRNVPMKIAQAPLGDASMKPRIMCDDESCCAVVGKTMDERREHSIRTRGRQLQEIEAQPHRAWRLNHVQKHAEGAVVLSQQANKILARDGMSERLKFKNFESLVEVLRLQREAGAA